MEQVVQHEGLAPRKLLLSPIRERRSPTEGWLAEVTPGGNETRHATPVTLRVVDYTLGNASGNEGEHRLLTTILDPSQAPPTLLPACYAERRDIKSAFDELKTHQQGPRTVVCSKSRDLPAKIRSGGPLLPLHDPHAHVEGGRRCR
jgi:hypothetical protein